MQRDSLVKALGEIVGAERVRVDAALAAFTTFRVGGPADCLVEAPGSSEVVRVVELARREGVPVTLLGGGSNVVVSDAGVRGVVVRAHGGRVADAAAAGSVRADSGVTMNALVRWTIARGYAGLEAWAGTPGTVGGAVFGNAHYGGRNISDFIVSVQCLADGGQVIDVPVDEGGFAYDTSRFQRSGEIILSAVFALTPGADPAALRAVAHRSLGHRKRTQPLSAPSAGCVFQNPEVRTDPEVSTDLEVGAYNEPVGAYKERVGAYRERTSAGALIDRAGLKGRSIGGARVSPTHANFIVNEGTATAADIRALVRLCQAEVRRQFGVELREEIRWVGEFE